MTRINDPTPLTSPSDLGIHTPSAGHGVAPARVAASAWTDLAAGVQQRMGLLEMVMADIYGAQTLLHNGLIPSLAIYPEAAYLRPVVGIASAQGRHWQGVHLRIAAFDVVHSACGQWQLVGQHCQTCTINPPPSVLAHALGLGSSPLPDTDSPTNHHAILTPGPYNKAYADHLKLAQQLGASLIEGSDVVVQDLRLYRKTVAGLEPVSHIFSYTNDSFLDPLELRADSLLGIPGLLQVLRMGHISMVNTPGVGVLDTPQMALAYPQLAQYGLGQELLLPAIAKSKDGADQPSRMDVLRVFAVGSAASAQSTPVWTLFCDGAAPPFVTPPALVSGIVSGIRTNLASSAESAPPQTIQHTMAARAAQNLYWVGRYCERCRNTIDLTQRCIRYLSRPALSTPQLRYRLYQLAVAHSLVLPTSLPFVPEQGVLDEGLSETVAQAIAAGLGNMEGVTSIGYSLRALGLAAASSRAHLSPPQWAAMEQLQAAFATPHPTLDQLAGIAAQLHRLQTDFAHGVPQDDTWLLLQIGYQLERIGFICTTAGFNLEHPEAGQTQPLSTLAATLQSLVQHLDTLCQKLPNAAVNAAKDRLAQSSPAVGVDIAFDRGLERNFGVDFDFDRCHHAAIALAQALTQAYFNQGALAPHSVGA